MFTGRSADAGLWRYFTRVRHRLADRGQRDRRQRPQLDHAGVRRVRAGGQAHLRPGQPVALNARRVAVPAHRQVAIQRPPGHLHDARRSARVEQAANMAGIAAAFTEAATLGPGVLACSGRCSRESAVRSAPKPRASPTCVAKTMRSAVPRLSTLCGRADSSREGGAPRSDLPDRGAVSFDVLKSEFRCHVRADMVTTQDRKAQR